MGTVSFQGRSRGSLDNLLEQQSVLLVCYRRHRRRDSRCGWYRWIRLSVLPPHLLRRVPRVCYGRQRNRARHTCGLSARVDGPMLFRSLARTTLECGVENLGPSYAGLPCLALEKEVVVV